jgi:hypothetical protein
MSGRLTEHQPGKKLRSVTVSSWNLFEPVARSRKVSFHQLPGFLLFQLSPLTYSVTKLDLDTKSMTPTRLTKTSYSAVASWTN